MSGSGFDENVANNNMGRRVLGEGAPVTTQLEVVVPPGLTGPVNDNRRLAASET